MTWLPLIFLLAAGPNPDPSTELSKERAAALLTPKVAFAADNVIVGEWKRRPGQWVALVYQVSDSNDVDKEVKLDLGIVTKRDDHWSVLAHGRDDGGGIGTSSYAFDFAPFRINETELAFGLRESTSYSSTAHSNEDTQLTLYRRKGNQIVPILKLPVSAWSLDKEGGDESASRSVVAVSKHKTNGFFDLVVTTSDTTGAAKRKKKTVQTYVWSQGAYKKAGAPR